MKSMISTPTTSGVLTVLTAFTWSFAILFGGGTRVGLAEDLLLQIVCLPLLILSMYVIFKSNGVNSLRIYATLIIVALLICAIQLVPLPPSLWSAFGQRDVVVETYKIAGIPLPWMPISLSSHATLYAFAALLPSIAIFLGSAILFRSGRFGFVIIPVVVSLAHVFTGIFQYANNTQGMIGDFQINNFTTYATGLFANKNHFAALSYAMLPLVVAWTINAIDSRSLSRPLAIASGASITAILITGILISYSRAGMLLGAICIAACIALFLSLKFDLVRYRRLMVVIVPAALLVFIIVQIGLISLLRERGVVDVTRLDLSRKSLDIIGSAPFVGYGFGTFVPVFMLFEHPADITRFYVNHIHNDWIEIVVEGGLVAGLMAVIFAVWVAVQTIRVWLTQSVIGKEVVYARAGSISVVMLLCHSAVDYPLRTAALAATFAACCAMLIGIRYPQPTTQPASSNGPAEGRRRRARPVGGDAGRPEARAA